MKCKVPLCTYDTVEDIAKTSTVSEHIQLITLHVVAAHPKPQQRATTDQPASTQARTEKINHPKLEMKDCCTSEESWDFFRFSWCQYKTIANITGNVKERLGVCLKEAVAGMVFARIGDARYNELSKENLFEEARQPGMK